MKLKDKVVVVTGHGEIFTTLTEAKILIEV